MVTSNNSINLNIYYVLSKDDDNDDDDKNSIKKLQAILDLSKVTHHSSVIILSTHTIRPQVLQGVGMITQYITYFDNVQIVLVQTILPYLISDN